MRILFTTYPNSAHLHILIPLAWAMRNAGHDVRIASQPELADEIVAFGFIPVVVGEVTHAFDSVPEYQATAPTDGARQEMPRQETYGADDPAAELADVVRNAMRVWNPEQAIDDLVEFARFWRPHMVVWDSSTYSGAVAAQACGAASARVLWGVDALAQLWKALPEGPDAMRDWLEPILHRHGCEFDEKAVVGDWTVDPMPPWQWQPDGVRYVRMRHLPMNPPAPVPEWISRWSGNERVCITLGVTHRAHIGVESFVADMLDAVSDLDLEVVATLNAAQIATARGAIPDNVRVVEYAPLNELLATCSAVVHHGGAKTFATAVENAVPQLIIPTAYYCLQWWGALAHANGVVDRGAGLHVADSDHVTVAAIREDLLRVTSDPTFGRNAALLRTEMLGLPTPHELVPVLTRLTWEHTRVS